MNQYTHRYSLTAADMDTIARNDAETAAQVYSEWIPRTGHIDVSAHALRK